jgi:O-antigen/teichoic acid export membrane protein
MLKKLISDSTKKYLFNSAWLLSDFFLRMVVGVFVIFYVARYLGPEQFGSFSYLLAITTLMIAISRLGMEALLVRELIRRPADIDLLMGTAFWMMTIAGLASYLVLVGISLALFGMDKEVVYFITISLGSIFTSFNVIEFYLQSQVKAKYVTLCRSIVLIIMSISKLALIAYSADIFWFFVTAMLDFLLLSFVFLLYFHIVEKQKTFLKNFSMEVAKKLLKSAWPLVLVTIALQAYMRTDQIMIKNMLGLYEVGIYSAAIRISEAWIIMMGAIAVSLLPAIIKLKEGCKEIYEYRMIQLYRLVLWLSVIAALILSYQGEYLIALIYGDEYYDASLVIGLLMWGGVLSSMGAVSSRYYNVEGMENKFAARTIFSALLNILLNYMLIPLYGIQGAAIATLISAFVANYLLDFFDKDLRALLRIKHKAVFGFMIK